MVLVKCPSLARKTGSSTAYVPNGKNFIEVLSSFYHDYGQSGKVLETV